MRTIQMTLNDKLVKAVDRVAKELNTSRSAFIRKALQEAIVRHKLGQLEKKHRLGYEKKPVDHDEFSVTEREQIVFGDPLETIWKNCIFGLCGVPEFYREMFNIVVVSSEKQRKKWLKSVRETVTRYFPAARI